MSQSPSPFSTTPGQPAGPAPVFAPPTVPGRVPVSTVWPQVIGITSIVIGGIGVLTNCIGVASSLFMSSMMKFAPTPPPTTTTTTAPDGTTTTTTSVTVDPMHGMQAAMGKYQGWLATGAGLQLLAAALLVVAGIMVLRRVRLGVTLHFSYAAFRTLTVIFYNTVNYLYMRDMMAGVAEQSSSSGGGGGPGPAMMSGFMSVFGLIGVVIGIVWGVAYPAFLVIWFNTDSVRRETQGWK